MNIFVSPNDEIGNHHSHHSWVVHERPYPEKDNALLFLWLETNSGSDQLQLLPGPFRRNLQHRIGLKLLSWSPFSRNILDTKHWAYDGESDLTRVSFLGFSNLRSRARWGKPEGHPSFLIRRITEILSKINRRVLIVLDETARMSDF